MTNLKLIIVVILCVLLLSLCFGSCNDKSSPTKAKEEIITSYGIDYGNPEQYIISGTQSTITDEEFADITQQLQFDNIDLSTLKQIYNWKNSYFENVSVGGEYIGKNTINDLLTNKELTGCHDHGLVLVSLLRKYDVPAILVDATGIDWALQYPETVTYFSGHVLVELYLYDKWMLFDSINGIYISDYDPTNPIIPLTNSMENKGYYAMFKGLDPADYGITDIQQLNDEQKRYAIMIKDEFPNFVFPSYTIEQL